MGSDHGAHVHISLFDRARNAEGRVKELEAKLAEARDKLDVFEMHKDIYQRVLRYVLFVLTGSDEVESDLCDAVQLAADRTKEKIADLNHEKELLVNRAHRQGKREIKNEIRKLTLAGIKGQPNPYTWAKQNYNGGWDQSRHSLVRDIDALEVLLCTTSSA